MKRKTLRNRIISTFWKGIASQNSIKRQKAPLKSTMFLYSFQTVFWTSRIIRTFSAFQRRQIFPVQIDQSDQHIFHFLRPCYMMKLCQMQQCTFRFGICSADSILLNHDDDVQTTIEHCFISSVIFFDQSFQPVSYDTVTCFFADRDSEAITFGPVFWHIHDKQSVCHLFSRTIDGSEILIFL